MSWEQVRRIEAVEGDDRLPRNQFKGPPRLVRPPRPKSRWFLVEGGFHRRCFDDGSHGGDGADGTSLFRVLWRAQKTSGARTCLDLVSRMPEVNAKHLFAYRHSMDGFVTIGLAAIAPDRLQAAAITGSGIAPEEGFPAPSALKAKQVRTPFLILHGSADPVVRPMQ